MHPSERAIDFVLCMDFLSWCDIYQGRWGTVLERSRKAADLARQQHERQSLAIALGTHAEALLNMGKLDQARVSNAESERICLELQEVGTCAYLQYIFCLLDLAEGDLEAARAAGMKAIALVGGIVPQLNCICQLGLARAELEDGDLEAGKRTVSEALSVAEPYNLSWPLATAWYLEGRAGLREGELVTAREKASESLARFEKIDSTSGMIEVLELIAEIDFATERFHDATRLLAVSQAHREITGFVVYPIHRTLREKLISAFMLVWAMHSTRSGMQGSR